MRLRIWLVRCLRVFNVYVYSRVYCESVSNSLARHGTSFIFNFGSIESIDRTKSPTKTSERNRRKNERKMEREREKKRAKIFHSNIWKLRQILDSMV